MSSTALIIAFVLMPGLLVAMTRFGVARIEAAHPPAGQFLEVEGVRLQAPEERDGGQGGDDRSGAQHDGILTAVNQPTNI